MRQLQTLGIDAVNPVNRLAPLNRGLKFWAISVQGWDGGRQFRDLFQQFEDGLGSRRNGTLRNVDPQTCWVPNTRPGALGRAVSLETGNDYIDYIPFTNFTNNAAYPFRPINQNTPFTMSWWFKINPLLYTNTRMMLVNWQEAAGDGWFSMFGYPSASDNNLAFGATNSSMAAYRIIYTTTNYSDGLWHMVGITHNGNGNFLTGCKMFVDGVQLSVTTASSLTHPTPVGPFPRFGSANSTTRFFPGQVDDIRVGHQELTPHEMHLLYHASKQGYPDELNRVYGYSFAEPGVSIFTATAALSIGSATASGSATFTKPTYTGSAAVSSAPTTLSGTATFTKPTYTSSGAISTAPATASGTATFTKPTYTGSGSITVAPATLAGSAEVDNPVYAATGAVTVGATTLAGSATFAVATFTASGAVSVAPTTLSGTATFTKPTYTGSGAISTAPATLAGVAEFDSPVYTASGAVAVGAATLAASGAFTKPTYTGTAAVTAGPATLSGTATYTVPTYTGSGTLITAPTTAAGTVTFVAPVYTATGALQIGAATLAGAAAFSLATIALDAVSNGGCDSGNSVYSWSHTCGGADRYLLVAVAMPGGTTGTAVTYNGTPLTLLKRRAASYVAELWGLAAPDTGAHDIEVTLSGTSSMSGMASSWTGVNQLYPTEAPSGGDDVSSTSELNATTLAANTVVVDIVSTGNNSLAVGSGQTQLHNLTCGPFGISGPSYGMSYAEVGAPATVLMDWDIGGIGVWSAAAVALRPTTAGVVTYFSTATLIVGAATLAGVATFTQPTYTGSGALATAPATLAAVGTFTKPTYTAAGVLVAGAATAAGTAAFTVPTYTAVAALAAGPATAAGMATFTPPVFTAAGTLAVAPATLAGIATFYVLAEVAGMGILGVVPLSLQSVVDKATLGCSQITICNVVDKGVLDVIPLSVQNSQPE
jgi:hypothetical protein